MPRRASACLLTRPERWLCRPRPHPRPWPAAGCRQRRRQRARPMPRPEYCGELCRRRKIMKISSTRAGSTPMPLSLMRNSAMASACLHSMRICGTTSGRRNLMALLRMFWNSSINWMSSPCTAGSLPTSISAPDWRMESARLSSAAWTTGPISTFLNACPLASMREKSSKPWICSDMRLPPSTMKSMNWSASLSSLPLYRFSSNCAKPTTVRSGS